MLEKAKKETLLVTLDPKSQALMIGDRQTVLPHKSWRVLVALVDAAPDAVSRTLLIDDIWSGNHEVGDRALNHALWTIRAALCDDAKRPSYIRTIPRAGYQWIGPAPQAHKSIAPFFGAPLNFLKSAAVAVSLALVLMLVLVQADTAQTQHIDRAGHKTDPQIILASTGSRAFFSGRDLILENPTGCQYVFKARPETTFSRPVFSEDGARMAFRAQQSEGCKLVIFKVGDDAPQIFDACPTIDVTGLDIPTLT